MNKNRVQPRCPHSRAVGSSGTWWQTGQMNLSSRSSPAYSSGSMLLGITNGSAINQGQKHRTEIEDFLQWDEEQQQERAEEEEEERRGRKSANERVQTCRSKGSWLDWSDCNLRIVCAPPILRHLNH